VVHLHENNTDKVILDVLNDFCQNRPSPFNRNALSGREVLDEALVSGESFLHLVLFNFFEMLS
jgi:hypothetical protein